jgi:hypothetical protein
MHAQPDQGPRHGPEDLLGEDDPTIYEITTSAAGPSGALPLTDEMLRSSPSGDLFGLSQNVGMGWDPAPPPTANVSS